MVSLVIENCKMFCIVTVIILFYFQNALDFSTIFIIPTDLISFLYLGAEKVPGVCGSFLQEIPLRKYQNELSR